MTKTKNVFNSRPLFYGFLALLLATSSARFVFDGNLNYIIPIVLALTVFLVYAIWSKKFVSICVIFSAFLFGFGWYFVGISTFQQDQIKGVVQVCGRISDDVDYASYETNAIVVLKDVEINSKKSSNIRLTIYINSKDDFKIGDYIAFETNVDNVNCFSFGKFNSFYYRDKTPYTAEVDVENISILSNRTTWTEKFRMSIKKSLYSAMGEQNGAIGYAVLFGDKSEVDDEVTQSFKMSGIIHLLTVSGLHIGFLITLLGYLLKLCRVRGFWNLLVCVSVLFFYALLCGFPPSIMRAGIMGIVLLMATSSGKCYDNLNNLGIAGILILLVSPLSSLDLGFLMSFFCVLGIFVIYPWLSKLLRKVFPKYISDSIAVSVSATIGILPFSAIVFPQLNILTFFINLIVIPIFSLIYPILFIGSLLATILPFFAFILKVCSFGFDAIYSFSSFFGQTQLTIPLSEFTFSVIALGFLFLFLLSRYFMAKRRVRIACCSVVVALMSIFSVVELIPHDSKLKISSCYNYSQSTILISNSQAESVIIDVGYTDFSKKVLKTHNKKSVETAFVLQNTTARIESAREIGVENLIRCGSSEGYAEEIVVPVDQIGKVGGFHFVFKSYKDAMIGLEIAFDGKTIFIFKDKKLSDDAIQTIVDKKYDLVFVGKQSYFAEKFERNVIIGSYYQSDYVDASFAKNGNIAWDLKSQEIKWRGLD